MDYEKMWKTLKWKLTVQQGKIINSQKNKDTQAKHVIFKIYNVILKMMDEIEREG